MVDSSAPNYLLDVASRADGPLDDLIDRLRRQGHRMTTPRRAVLVTLLAAEPQHLTADDLAQRIRDDYPDVDVSTVYRTLTLLDELGIVQHAHLGHRATVYHLGDHHQHLICEECGLITDIPLDVLDDLRTVLRRDYKFELHPEHFGLMGRCRAHQPAEHRHATATR
jgi:Fur family ferric uptake transcriptional regulator